MKVKGFARKVDMRSIWTPERRVAQSEKLRRAWEIRRDRRRAWSPERRATHQQAVKEHQKKRAYTRSYTCPVCRDGEHECAHCRRIRLARIGAHAAETMDTIVLSGGTVIDRLFWLDYAADALTYQAREPDWYEQLKASSAELNADKELRAILEGR